MNVLNTGLRAALFCGVSASTILFCSASYAQATASDMEQSAELVVVTGSRIKQAAQYSPSPLQVVGADQIAAQGTINIQDALQLNPSLGLPGDSRNTSNYSSTGAGLATLNLRNLGADRTLVLIDGRRVVAGKPGTAQVDVTMIPTPFLERVEVLTGGASAVYGSDAVAGVVNFIYKKHFEGLAVNAQAGESQEGDDQQWSVNLTAGSDFASGKGNAMVYAGWTDEGTVFSRDRTRTAYDQTSLGLAQRVAGNSDANLAAAKNIFVPERLASSVIPGGVFTAGGQAWVVNPDGTARLQTSADAFNRQAQKAISSPVDNLTFATRVNYNFSEHLNVYVEGTYAHTKATTYMEASPLLSSGANGVFRGNNGYYNIQGYAFNPNTGQSQLTNNPLVPTAIFNAATDHTGDSLKDISFSLRMTEFPPGQRLAPVERDNFRFVFGGEGAINENWSYDIYYEYGLTKAFQQMVGLVNEDAVAEALDVVQDVWDLNHNGSTTDAICASADARGRGCVPLNIYGAGKMSAAALSYVAGTLQRNARQTQQVVSANITGSLFKLPAGPVQVAAGMEYRDESSSEIFDPLTNRARNSYVQLTNPQGSMSVKEGYAEVNVPLVSGKAWADNLSVRAAARISDYSTVGSFWAYNFGLEYAPVSDVRLRAVYAHAVRAPNIGELYAAPNAGVATISDP